MVDNLFSGDDVKYTTKQLAEAELKRLGYVKSKDEWIGAQDCRRVLKMPTGGFRISGREIPLSK